MADTPRSASTVDTGFTSRDAVRSVWAFLAPFLVTFLVAALGIINNLIESCRETCDWNTAKVAGVAAAIGLGSAVVVGIKNWLLADGSRLKG